MTSEEVGESRKTICCMKFKMKAGCCKCDGLHLHYCGDGMANSLQYRWKSIKEKKIERLGTGLKP